MTRAITYCQSLHGSDIFPRSLRGVTGWVVQLCAFEVLGSAVDVALEILLLYLPDDAGLNL